MSVINKEEFRSRPINAFVDIFALSQSECIITKTLTPRSFILDPIFSVQMYVFTGSRLSVLAGKLPTITNYAL